MTEPVEVVAITGDVSASDVEHDTRRRIAWLGVRPVTHGLLPVLPRRAGRRPEVGGDG
jgi:hypothetical protein